MPSVVSSRRNEWFSPVTCEICNKALGNVPALINHLRSHMIDMRTNPNIATPPASTAVGRSSVSSPPTNFHQSLLSPSSFSLFQTSSVSGTNPNPRHHHHHAVLSPALAIHKPNTGFSAGPMMSYNSKFSVLETPPTLYNVVPYYNKDANRHVVSDGITRRFIHLLDRPVPVVIELDSEGEDNEAQNREKLDLRLAL